MGSRRLAGFISNGLKGLGAPRLPRLEGFTLLYSPMGRDLKLAKSALKNSLV